MVSKRVTSPKVGSTPKAAKPLNLKDVAEASKSRQQTQSASWLSQKWGILALVTLAALVPVGVVLQTDLHTKLEPAVESIARSALNRFSKPVPAAVPRKLAAVAPGGGCSGIQYDTTFSFYLCPTEQGMANPVLKNKVKEEHVQAAASSLKELYYPAMDDTTVTFSNSLAKNFKCPIDSSIQVLVAVGYNSDGVGGTARRLQSQKTTTDDNDAKSPVGRASKANDWANYDPTFATTLFDAIAVAAEAEPGSIGVNDLQLVSSGWIAKFPDTEGSVPAGQLAFGKPMSMDVEMERDRQWWPIWVWFLFALAVLACMLPLCVIVLRRRVDPNVDMDELDALKKKRGEEGLEKLYGPEWGITELDFEDDYGKYEDPSMRAEYAASHATSDYKGQHTSNNSPRVDAADAAWQQEGGQRSDWAAASSANAAPRRFDIDDRASVDFDHLRSAHPHYSFDNAAS